MSLIKTILMLTFSLLLLTSCENEIKTKTIVIKNHLDLERTFETIELRKFSLKIDENDDLSNYSLKDINGEVQIVQYVDENEDGKVDIILFQPKVAPNSESNYELVKVLEKEKKKVDTNCYSRFVPERTDDYAWENDKVAFRVFGPTAQKMFEDGIEGGTLSSGVDCWLKRVDYPVINNWYKKHTEETGSYHEDTGEGLDNFHVGVSRGCGGLAIKKDSVYHISKNFTKYKTLMTGPIRTSFYLEYEDWDASGTFIKESKIISLDFGNNLSKFEITIEGSKEVATGLTLHEKDGDLTKNSENNWVSYWEPHGDSELGTAILTSPEFFNGFDIYNVEEKDNSNAFLQLNVLNNKTTYYTGFGWKKSGQFNSKEEWNIYLDKIALRLKTPLEVRIN